MDELVRCTQELFDAVVFRVIRALEKTLTPMMLLYSTKKDAGLNKTALVADITPMPKESGAIKIVRPQSRIFGTAAVLSYDLDKTETIFGQKFKARYHETDHLAATRWHLADRRGTSVRYYEDPALAKLTRKGCRPSSARTNSRPADQDRHGDRR